jgi:hypothetical protein
MISQLENNNYEMRMWKLFPELSRERENYEKVIHNFYKIIKLS